MHAPRSALIDAAFLEVCVELLIDDNRPADSESPIESNSTSFADCPSPPPNNGIAAPVTCSLALGAVCSSHQQQSSPRLGEVEVGGCIISCMRISWRCRRALCVLWALAPVPSRGMVKHVHQTEFSPAKGNALQACIARWRQATRDMLFHHA